MLINYLTTRKALGYQYLIDTKWSDRLMLITDSTFVVVKNVGVNKKRKMLVIFTIVKISLSTIEFAEAIGTSTSLLPTPTSKHIMRDRDANRLID